MLLTSLVLSLSTPVAYAQDEGDESSEDGGSSGNKRVGNGQVREIVRGLYTKSDVGGAMYLGRFAQRSVTSGGQYASAGTFVSFAVGQDFLDQERTSMAWEIDLDQGLHNGVGWDSQASDLSAGQPAPLLEGDFRTYTAKAMIEYSFYPLRRLGVGIRAGGGILYSPLLIEPNAYQTRVLPAFGGDPLMHNTFHPVFGGGPTIEYYTKLSHFSVGADADVFYGLNWDLGLNVAGYLKYTF